MKIVIRAILSILHHLRKEDFLIFICYRNSIEFLFFALALALFLLTVVVYSAVWCWLSKPALLKEYAKRVALIALLCVPININGYVFTAIGNAASQKSVYSLFSLYQKADRNAATLIGLAGYQKADNSALAGIGIAFYQSVVGKVRAFGAFTRLKKD